MLVEQAIDQMILRTVFLYFFELMGIQKDKDLKSIMSNLFTLKREQDWDHLFERLKIEEIVKFENV